MDALSQDTCVENAEIIPSPFFLQPWPSGEKAEVGYGKELLNGASGAPGLSLQVLIFLSIFPTQQVLVAPRCSPDTREAVML